MGTVCIRWLSNDETVTGCLIPKQKHFKSRCLNQTTAFLYPFSVLRIAQEILAKYGSELEPTKSKIITSLNENAIL